MATWDAAKKKSEEAAGPGIFIRLQDHGDKFVGAFLGEPEVTEAVWNEKLSRYEDPTPENTAARKATARYKINVYHAGDKMVKIWEVNNQTFKDIVKCREKFGIENQLFEVERNGKKGNSKTTYTILPEAKISEYEGGIHAKLIADAKLHDLTKEQHDEETDMSSHDKAKGGSNGATANGAAHAPATAPTTAPAASSETIDPETSSKLVGRLKALPREKLMLFLGKFAVQQVKALKKSDGPAAEAYLCELEGKPAAAPAIPDPFAE